MPEGFLEKRFYNIKNMRSVPNLNTRRHSGMRLRKTVTYHNRGGNWPGFSVRDNFAVRWTGQIQIKKAGKYSWRIGSDDGSNLYFEGSKVVSNDGLHGFRNRIGSKKNTRGANNINLDFFERGGHAGMTFAYKGLDTRNRWVWVGGCCSKVHPIAAGPMPGAKKQRRGTLD